MYEWLAIVMFVLFLILILSGYPVAFSFAGTAIAFGALGLALGAFDLNLLKLLPVKRCKAEIFSGFFILHFC